MQIAAIIQARMSSRRLPGKVLKEAHGKPMLHYLFERLARCRSLDAVTVATSDDPSDDRIAEFCRRQGLACFRGDLFNVAGRFKAALDALACDGFVRVNGDSPLLDPHLVDRAVAAFRDGSWDLVTNVFPRTFPAGQSVEVLRTDTYCWTFACMREPLDLEHVTRYFYRNPETFRILNIPASEDFKRIHLAVDTQADFDRFCCLVGRMTRPHFRYGLTALLELASTRCAA